MITAHFLRAGRQWLLTSALLCACLPAHGIPIGPYDQVFAFGDSISDNGNVALAISDRATAPYADLAGSLLVPAAPYDVSGRFSNGPVWTDMAGLTPSLLGGTNYAFGGAETGPLAVVGSDGDISIKDQVNMFQANLGGSAAPGQALYVVAPVGNDLRRAIEVYVGTVQSTGDMAQAQLLADSVLTSALGNVEDIIRQLYGLGARHLMISNVADLGLTPSIQLLDSLLPLDVQLVASGLSAGYASLLDQLLDQLTTELAADLKLLDVFGLINDIVANPGAFGLANASGSCITPGIGACSNPDDYLFWDGVHLTTAGQAILFNAIQAAAPSPASWLLITVGMLMLRRRQSSATDGAMPVGYRALRPRP